VQGFVDASVPGGSGVTVAPLEAFALRRDLGGFTFEALGNDQNYKESTRDQHRVTDFRFRYSLRAHSGDYNNAETVAWSRAVSTPLLVAFGKIKNAGTPNVVLDPRRAVAVAFRPALFDARRNWQFARQNTRQPFASHNESVPELPLEVQ